MNAKKLLAVALVALLAVASFAPAFAAEKVNVMKTATWVANANLDDTKYNENEDGTKSDPTKLIDGIYGVGPANKQDTLNTRVIDQWVYYNENDEEDEAGLYMWTVTFELDKVYTIDSTSVIVMDLTTCGIGASHPIQWVQRGFHLLVSETGEAGSWKVALEAEDLHPEDDLGEYEYVEPSDEYPTGYYIYKAEFDAVNAKFVKYASTCPTTDLLSTGNWINFSEWEVYGTPVAGQTEDTTPVTEDTTPVTEDTTPVTEDTTPVTEDTTPVTEDTTPVTEDTTPVTEDTTPVTDTTTDTPDAPATFDFVIVPAVALAAAAAGAVVLKKKEN